MKFNINNIILYLFGMSMFLSTTGIQAQNGAGGTGLTQELWLSADKIGNTQPADGADVTNWQDRSSNGFSFVKNGTNTLPRISYEDGNNFHPTVQFYASGAPNADGDPVVVTADQSRKLVSSKSFTTSASKSYYTFMVSEVDQNLSNSTSALFSFSGGNDYDGFTPSSGAPLMRSNSGGLLRWSGAEQKASPSISATMRPNIYTNAYPQYMYWDGVQDVSTRGILNNGYARGQAIIGNSTLTTTYFFIGNVHEIIILSAPAGSYMSTGDLAKIHSYLAIKYGVTLKGLKDYVNSDGIAVWSNSKNAGYSNDIFGIGRDDASGLYQKQAVSADNSKLTIFVGDQLADINNNNNSTYFNNKDKSYLMFGANNLEDLSSYDYKPGTGNFLQGSITEEVNFRQDRVLRAQATGQSSFTVNMKVGAKYVLVSANDPTFAPANTRLYPIIKGIAKDVVINDGDYVSFASYETAPGGVINGLKLWLKADDLSSLTLNANKVLAWADQTSNNNVYSFDAVGGYTGKTAPDYQSCDNRTNFYPTISFTETSYLATKSGPMDNNAPVGFTSFLLYYATAYANANRLYTNGFGSTQPRNSTTRYPAMGFSPERGGGGRIRNDGAGTTNINGTFGFEQNTTALQMINTQRKTANGEAAYVIYDFGGWQQKITNVGTGFGDGFKMAKGSTLGGASTNDGTFQGLIPEVFFYERTLSEADQDKIRTYLGIKYGVTLDVDRNNPLKNYDYKLSDGTIVWPGNSLPNQKYHRNVAGLIRDDESNLFNNKAKSSADEATITMAVKGHTECGQGTSSKLINDRSGLFWGHNGLTNEVSLVGNPDVCGDMDIKMGRIWLVDKTNLSEQAVDISIGTSSYFPYGSKGYQLYLLVASSAEDLNNNKWSQIIPAKFINGEHQLSYTFRHKYTYFTIGVKPLPGGGCEACEFTGVKKLDFTNTNWPRGAKSAVFNMGDGFTANVKTTIGTGASFYNRYPQASNLNSLREYRKGQSQSLMTTEISLSTAAAANFQIFEIGRSGSRFDYVEVYGMCNGAKVIPMLSYTNSSKNSSYTITGNIATGKRQPTTSYNNNRGKMYVEFEYPVEKIYVVHKSTGAKTGAQRIGIGPIEFMCPVPTPPVNEDGLVMTKQGPTSVLLCEDVTYVFRIYNANCSAKEVDFSDVLPEGMSWISNSLSLDDAAIGNNTNINEYGQTKDLKIEDLIVAGGQTLTFRAKANFDMNAKAGTYSNQSKISYQQLVNDVLETHSLTSCDRLSTGCEPTKTVAIDVPDRPYPVELIANSSSTCYKENNEITVTMTLKNPNATISNTELEIDFNEEFTYIANSLQSATITGLSSPQTTDPGMLYVGGFNLPTGQHTITFKIKAPDKSKLVEEVDQDGNPILNTDGTPSIAALDINIELSVDSDDVCIMGAFSNANGEIELPYCISKEYIISNKMATGRIVK